MTAPIFGRCSRPIGEVAFKYLVIRPIQNSVLTMAVSRFSHYAPGTGNPTMDIAHRGMGKGQIVNFTLPRLFTCRDCLSHLAGIFLLFWR